MFTMYSVFSHQWWRNFVSYKLSICFCSILALLVLVMLQKLPDYIRRIQVSFIQLFLLPPDAGMNASGTRPTYFPDGFFTCTSAGDTLSRLQQALPHLTKLSHTRAKMSHDSMSMFWPVCYAEDTSTRRLHNMAILEVKSLKKIYTTRFGGNQVQALSNVSFSVEQGEYVAIMGESGSGKTTLLNILAALNQPTSGQVLLDGRALSGISEKELAAFRRKNLGFVFQEFNLLDTFSIRDNILLPLVLSNTSVSEMEKRLQPVVQQLGIADLLNKYPYEISGGQKQRAAVARAIITEPRLILADEPTGALDSRSTDDLLQVFQNINSMGQTILMVTHSTKAASHANRVLFIKDGEVFHQIYRGGCTNEQMYQKIANTLTILATGGDKK